MFSPHGLDSGADQVSTHSFFGNSDCANELLTPLSVGSPLNTGPFPLSSLRERTVGKKPRDRMGRPRLGGDVLGCNIRGMELRHV